MHTRPPNQTSRQNTSLPPTDALNVVSLNIEGIKGNSTYLNSLISPENIVCIQEHWLWDFETNIMDQFWSDFDYYSII